MTASGMPYFKYDYPRNAEWVPIEVAWELREYNRRLTDPDRVAALKASLTRFGQTAPLIITYYAAEQSALLGEGNHRLAAAVELGWKRVLMRVVRNERYYGSRHPTSRTPMKVMGAVPECDTRLTVREPQRVWHSRDLSDYDIDGLGYVTACAFHGTPFGKLKEFKTPRGFPPGFFFTSEYDVAYRYAIGTAAGRDPYVVQAEIGFRRPLLPKDGGEMEHLRSQIPHLQGVGYDALVRFEDRYKNRFGQTKAGWEICVFDPQQIRIMGHGYVRGDLTPREIGLPGEPLSAAEIALDGTRVPGVPED